MDGFQQQLRNSSAHSCVISLSCKSDTRIAQANVDDTTLLAAVDTPTAKTRTNYVVYGVFVGLEQRLMRPFREPSGCSGIFLTSD